MAISSQTLKEILEAFKSQLYDTLNEKLDAFGDGLNDSFRSIQDWLDSMQERFLMVDIEDEYNQEIYVWYDIDADFDDWYMDIVFMSGMTTNSIFYLMTLLHLL